MRDFGARGDGVTDDIDALERAVAFAIKYGLEIQFPTGSYRITRTLKIGRSRWNSYNLFVERTRDLSSGEINPLENDDIEENYQSLGVSLRAIGTVNIIADIENTTNEFVPVVEYNIMRNGGQAFIKGTFRVIPPGLFDGKRYQRNSNYVPSGNLIGWVFNGHALKNIDGIAASGMQVGVCAVAMFWCKFENLSFEYCGDCVNMPNCNAVTLRNVDMWNSDRGLIFDGGSSYLGQLHTQQVGEDLILFFSECCTIENCYLEDVTSEDGTGDYAVTLGQDYNENTKIIATQLNGVRVGSRRQGKKSFRIHGAAGLTIIGSREYSGGVDVDTVSYGALIGTDFLDTPELPPTRFPRL